MNKTLAIVATISLVVSVTLGTITRPVDAAPPAPCPTPTPTATPVPTPTPVGPFLFDDFESGNFSKWTTVTATGDATATVQSTTVFAGTKAGYLHVTSSSTSKGNISKTLPAGTSAISLTGHFNIQGEGLSNSNVPAFRLFNNGTRILDVYRQNVSAGLWLRTNNGAGGWTFYNMNRTLNKFQWYTIKLQVGPANTVTVSLDGTQVFSQAIPLVSTTFTDAMVGAEHFQQVMDLYFDDITIAIP